MKIAKKKIALVAAFLFLLSILPIIPVSMIALNDPKNRDDKRVTIDLSDQDLTAILTKVRGGNNVTLAKITMGKLGVTHSLHPVIAIKETLLSKPDVIDVWTGHQCGPLCGFGTIYSLKKIKDEWELIAQGPWAS